MGLLLLATLACSALGDTIGFFILGANLTKLKKPGVQRVKHALDLAVEHPNDHHVFFLSGAHGEAEDMESKIRKGYRGLLKNGKLPSMITGSFVKRGPRIILEKKANFTVKNFIMTIPKINAYCKEYNLHKVYLVTSGYHMCRSEAVLNEFVDAGLTSDISTTLTNFMAVQQDIEDPKRDQSNARIFATMIAREAEIDSFANRDSNDTLTARYLRNNNARTQKDKREKTKQLQRLVNGCARKLSL